MDKKDFSDKKNKICTILLAYTVHNKEVSYATATLIKITNFIYTAIQSEEMTFWVLDGMIKYILPGMYFVKPFLSLTPSLCLQSHEDGFSTGSHIYHHKSDNGKPTLYSTILISSFSVLL
jgi:hypothetical protein